MKEPTLGRLAALIGRIGNLTFGGGDPTMAVLYQELVERRRWLADSEYALIWSLARVTPGTNLMAFCVGVGWRLAGVGGALAATAALIVPSAATTVWLAFAYETFQKNLWAMAAIGGVLAAAVGMMAAGAWQILGAQFRSRAWHRPLAIAGGALLLAQGLDVPPIAVLGAAAVTGIFWRGADTQ